MRIALFCIMAERARHIHAQRSFRFLVERHKTLANGTLGITTRLRSDRSSVRRKRAVYYTCLWELIQMTVWEIEIRISG